jgi:beta-N-acetylhexosaminidase
VVQFNAMYCIFTGNRFTSRSDREFKHVNPLVIQSLSTEQKIGQMLLMRNPIDQDDFEFVIELVRQRALGGIHISHKYVKDNYYAANERVILDRVLAAADYPILVCEDMEYGYPKGEVSMPYQMAIGATGSEELAYEYGRITAIEAKRAGYNLVFGPILDIAENPKACCVGSRSYGARKEFVARLAAATIRGYQDNGMVVAAKHFPGFGESAVDNHIGMVYLGGDEKAILEHEMYPYTWAARHAGLSGVMMGHIMVPKIDPIYPASISPKLIQLLRANGYQGLIMTDSFAMIGMTNLFPLPDCHKLAMAAGNDMVMTSYRMSARQAYGYMIDAHREGTVTEEQITQAALHVIEAQNKTLKPAQKAALDDADRGITRLMAKQAVAAQLSGVDTVALDTAVRHLFVIQEGVVYKDPISGAIKADKCDLEVATQVLKSRFRNADFVALPEFPAKPQIEHLMARTLEYSSVVMVLANQSVSYTGSSDASQRMVSIIDGLREKLSAIVLYGCPYAAREFGRIKRVIFGFDGMECQRVAALALAGEHTPVGRIPVSF